MSYDVFISYARATTTEAAGALKRGLEQYAREWNKARSTRLFLDDSSLTASASLGASISSALGSARWLVVLLSEAAAQSPWVDREIAWWLTNRGPDSLLLVQVDGRVSWTEGEGFSPESTAVPTSLSLLTTEPRWVDFTWFNSPASLKTEDPRFGEIVLQVFCPIHGLDRGEAVALRDANVRRAKTLTRVALITLSLLLVAAIVSALTAVAQMRTAQGQRDLATARLLATESQRLRDENVGLSRLFAAQAAMSSDEPETRRTLFQSLASGPHLVGETVGRRAAVLALLPDGSSVFFGDPAGAVWRWDVSERRTLRLGDGCAPLMGLTASDDGRVVVGECGPDSPKGFALADGVRYEFPEALAVSVSPSGQTVAVLGGDSELLMGLGKGSPTRQPLNLSASWGADVALRDDQTLVVLSRTFNLEPETLAVFDIPSGSEAARFELPDTAPENPVWLSRSGEVVYDSQHVTTWDAGTRRTIPRAVDASGEIRYFTTAAISEKGTLVASEREGGRLEVTRPSQSTASVAVVATLESGERLDALAVTDSGRVVAARRETITMWDIHHASPVLRQTPGTTMDAEGGTDVSVSPSGSRVAIGDVFGMSIWSDAGEKIRDVGDGTWLLAWRDDAHYFVWREGTVRLQEVDTGVEVSTWQPPRSLKPFGLLGGWDSKAQVLVFGSPHALLRLDPGSGMFEERPLGGRQLEGISADGLRVSVKDGDARTVWDSRMSTQIYEAPPSSYLVLLDNGDIEQSAPGSNGGVWLDPGNPSESMAVTQHYFSRLPVSPNGELYLSTERSGMVKIIARDRDRELARFPAGLLVGMTVSIRGAFSRDGNTAVVLSNGGMLTWVTLKREALLDAVCSTVNRSLTPAEYREVTGSDPDVRLACA